MKTYYYKMNVYDIAKQTRKTFAYEVFYPTKIMFLADLNGWNRLSMLTHRRIYVYCQISKDEFLNIKHKKDLTSKLN